MAFISVPVLGTTGRRLNVGRALHMVPDEIVVRRLASDLDYTAEGADWYAVVLFANGIGSIRGRGVKSPAPPPDALDRMVELAVMLNREVHFGGHWVVFWSDDRMQALYRDGQGNGLIAQKFDDPWARVKSWPLTDLAERCEAAMAQGIGMLSDHGARPGEAGSRFN